MYYFTVFLDVIFAISVGVFLANILNIDQLFNFHSETVKVISDTDDKILLTDAEKQLLVRAEDRALLVYLSALMIFGVSKAIAPEHAAIKR